MIRVIIEDQNGQLFRYERGANCLFPADEDRKACADILREAGSMFGSPIVPLKVIGGTDKCPS